MQLQFSVLRSAALIPLLGFLAMPLLAGCGRNVPTPSSESSTEPGGQPAQTNSPHTSSPAAANGAASPASTGNAEFSPRSSAPQTAAGGSPTKVRVDADGRKWIGNIPYDVWFNDPLAVAAEDTKVAAIPTERPLSPAEGTPSDAAASSGTTPADEPKPLPDASGSDWQSLVPMPVLEAETKKIRNHLTESLRSVGQYNANYKEIQVDGATLAALGAIVLEHPDAVSWKENAGHVRDLGAKLEQEAQGLGKKSFDATQIPFEQLIVILNGSTPAGLEAAIPSVDFAERADRNGLMRRMQKSFEWMRKNVTTETVLKGEKDNVLHETAILGALATVIATPGYTSADEPEYKKAADGLIEACREITKAAQADNFTGFTENLEHINKKCLECHTEYRFE